jgi:hypothetical protein
MITINKGESNTVIVTVSEKVTIANPYFLFEFRGDTDLKYYYCLAADISQFTYRYNQFTIIEKANPNPLNGEISLPNAGYYHYAIYQTATADLNPAHASGVIEVGKARVIGTTADPVVYEPGPQTYIIYQGN